MKHIVISNAYILRQRDGDWELVNDSTGGVSCIGSVRFNSSDQAECKARSIVAQREGE